jgi:hypothetical protein
MTHKPDRKAAKDIGDGLEEYYQAPCEACKDEGCFNCTQEQDPLDKIADADAISWWSTICEFCGPEERCTCNECPECSEDWDFCVCDRRF